jgi:DNA-binding NtrC family response regulator
VASHRFSIVANKVQELVADELGNTRGQEAKMPATESRQDVMARRAELSVCVVDDDPALVKITARRLKQAGFNAIGTTEPEEALRSVRAGQLQSVVLDIRMPGMSGHEFLEQALAIDPALQVVLVTGYYSIESAIGAIKKGASDYLCKPLEFDRLVATLDRFAIQAADKSHARKLDEQLLLNADFHGIVGKSPAILEVFDQVRKIARHFTTVLMSGPTGSGKEVIARALHALSPAAAGEFHLCTCSALEDIDLEDGVLRWKQAASVDGSTKTLNPSEPGTLYLDEVTELPLRLQSALLAAIQAIENGRSRANDMATGLRIVASSSHDLKDEVAAGRFREDLFFRLAPLEIRIPGLAHRSQDIPLLVQHFLKTWNPVYGTSFRGLTRRAQIALLHYDWVGNVRELEHTICGAMMVGSGQFIDVRDLPKHVQNPGRTRPGADWKPVSLAELRRMHVEQVLAVAENLTHAAAILGIGRTSLYRMLKQRPAGRDLQKVS